MEAALYGFGIIPLIIGLVEVVKEVGIPSRFAPIAALITGVAAGFAVQYATSSPQLVQAIVTGVAYGLAASGLYSGVSAYVQPSLSAVSSFIQPSVSTTVSPPATITVGSGNADTKNS